MQQARIMVVEDELLIATDLAKSLLKLGYHSPSLVSSVEQALERIPKDLPDLVLMDINLGEGRLNGIDGAQRVRNDFDLPVIFLTAHSDGDTLNRAKRAEPFGYLVKPVRQASLTSSIETGLYKHRIEKHLRERESWLSTIIESLPNFTILTDLEGTIRFSNAATKKLLQDDATVLKDQAFRDSVPLFDTRTGTAAEDLIGAALLLRQTLPLPAGLVLRTASGNTAVEGEVTPTFAGEKAVGAIITLRDVAESDHTALEVCRQKTLTALGRMAAELGTQFREVHDLILNGSEHAFGQTKDLQHTPGTKQLLEAAARASDMSRQLLTLSRAHNVRPELVNLNVIVQRILRLVDGRLPDMVNIEVSLTNSLFNVRATPRELDQVLLTLIERALESMPHGGTIRISTSNFERHTLGSTGEVTEEFIRLLVSDSGSKLSQEEQQHMFEPFYINTRGSRVSGIGLSLAYNIIKYAGGEITSKGDDAGGGTTFEIVLPRDEQMLTINAMAKRNKCILLVQTAPAILALLQNYLESDGYGVLPAENSRVAIVIADSWDKTIDLLVVPGGEHALVSYMRTTRPALRVLFLSRATRETDDLEASTQDIHLRGGFSLADVLRCVRTLTNKRQRP